MKNKKKTSKKTSTKSKDKDLPKENDINPGTVMFSLERSLFKSFGKDSDKALSKAQDIAYRALEEEDPQKQIGLAFDALKVSMDCADAWSILAAEAESPMESIMLYMLAIKAGERSLGDEFFDENFGKFWGIIETRPYMRAQSGLAKLLFDLGQTSEAIEIFELLLELNPDDNQGNRYILAAALVEKKKFKDLKELLDQFDDASAFWQYSQAIISFAKHGDSKKSRELLQAAIESNPYVPELLLNSDEMPELDQPFYSPGGMSEAIIYVDLFSHGWDEYPSALKWLARNVKEAQSGKG